MNKILVYSIVICALTGKVGKEHRCVCVGIWGTVFNKIIKESPQKVTPTKDPKAEGAGVGAAPKVGVVVGEEHCRLMEPHVKKQTGRCGACGRNSKELSLCAASGAKERERMREEVREGKKEGKGGRAQAQ